MFTPEGLVPGVQETVYNGLSLVAGTTRLVTAAEVVELPAASVATTWSPTLPSATEVEAKVDPVDCQLVPPSVEYS